MNGLFNYKKGRKLKFMFCFVFDLKTLFCLLYLLNGVVFNLYICRFCLIGTRNHEL